LFSTQNKNQKLSTTEDTEVTEIYLLIAPAMRLTIVRFSLWPPCPLWWNIFWLSAAGRKRSFS